MGKSKCHSDTREPRPHNRISVTIYSYVRLMVCDMFPTPRPLELAIYDPCSPSHFVTKEYPSASGLVVKFNVAIVEPPVRFRACARATLLVIFSLFKDNPTLFRPRDAIDEPRLEGDEVRVQIYYVRCVLNHDFGSAQVSSLRFRSYTGHWLLSCVTLIALYRPLGQKDSNN